MTEHEKAVPEYMNMAFSANDIPYKDLLFAVHTDLTIDGGFSDTYVAVDKNNLYILYGEERVVKTEGAKRIVSEYITNKKEVYSLKELGELKTQLLLSTCRLISTANEQQKLIMLFSLGHQGLMDRLVKVASNIAKDEEPLKEIKLNDELFCPKCGTRYPEPERKICPKCLDKMSIFFRLLGFFKFYKAKVAILFALMIVITGFAVLAPYIGTRLFIDEVLREGELEFFGYTLFGLVGIVVLVIIGVRLLNLLFDMIYGYILAGTMPWIIYDLQLRIFEAMQRLSVSFYTSKRTGALMNRVGRDSRNIYWFFIDGMPWILINAAIFIGVFIVMLAMNWQLALICIIVVPFSMVMFKILMTTFRKYHHKFWVVNSQMNNMVSDAVNGQRVIKAFAREETEGDRFKKYGDKQADIQISSSNLAWTAFPAIYAFMFLGQIVVTIVGSMMVINGEITLGVFLAFLAYLGMLYRPLEFLTQITNWWARCMDAAQRVFEVIDAQSDLIEPENPVRLPEVKGDIHVKDCWFRYDPAVPVLKGLNLKVKAGQSVGIVGKTGSGKSTLANLIARLYDPNEGEIYVDGENVRNLELDQLRKSIGIVSQEIYLFIGSIAENIAYAKPDATIEEIIWAAKMASAHDFIAALPDGYETRVGAGGQDLSGGERQRLSIARTIIQNPRILILDEATAAMDTETEGKIQEALNKLSEGRTSIIIAHRLSTLKDVDTLVVIKDGVVTETGTHEELMIKKGEYHKLYNIQMEGLKVISMD